MKEVRIKHQDEMFKSDLRDVADDELVFFSNRQTYEWTLVKKNELAEWSEFYDQYQTLRDNLNKSDETRSN